MTTPAAPNFGVADFWRIWSLQAPNTLNQPILPWSLNINSHNSSAPQTEAEIVARHSYGRQIGRLSDALHALILELHPPPHGPGPLQKFILMRSEIEQVKLEGAKSRLDQIASDLALLKIEDREAYLRLREDLDRALKLSK